MQYALISPTPFVYPTHPGPLIIPDRTTTHANSNTRIVHTTEVRLFRGVMGVEQDLVQQIVDTVEVSYLADICNRTTNLINDTMADVLTHLQEKYGQLMPHDLLEREDTVKKFFYNPHDLIMTMLSSVEELLEFSHIMGTSYTQFQAINITYIILHRTSNFGLAISEWNHMPAVQKTWVSFKQFFRTSHRELQKTSDLTVEDAGMHHANMVCDVVAGLQEDLHQEQTHTETLTSMKAPVDHVANAVQSNHQQLATQLQKIQSMMQTMQMHYNAVPHGT